MDLLNLAMIGNLVATALVGVAVWLGMQWRPSPQEDTMMMVAIGLAFVGGVLTALSSQVTVRVEKDTSVESTR
jgi:hypothetical protein